MSLIERVGFGLVENLTGLIDAVKRKQIPQLKVFDVLFNGFIGLQKVAEK